MPIIRGLDHATPFDENGCSLLDYNESPLGPSRRAVRRAVREAHNLHRYPRGLHELTERAAAEVLGVPARRVLLTSGVDETLDLLVPSASVVCYCVPGFNGFWHRASAHRRAARAFDLNDEWLPVTGPDELPAGSTLLLAQPNNPTGNFFRSSWLEAAFARSAAVLVDETYIEFSDRSSSLTLFADHDNLLVYRSFSKVFGLAGVRAGVLVAPERMASALRCDRHFYPVDRIALAAVLGTIEDRDHVRRTAAYVRRARPALAALLREHRSLFAEVRDTEANFVLARCVRAVSPQVVRREFLACGVAVQDAGAHGLDGWIRVSVGTAEDLARLEAAAAHVAEEMPT